MKILLFGGTSEGRDLAQWLLKEQIPFLVCVATEYGEALLEQNIPVHVGRLTGEDMKALFKSEQITHVVDATHPYAHVVTETIKKAAGEASLPLYRLVRDGDVEGDWLTASSAADAGEKLRQIPGNILLTTGAKELDAYALPELLPRAYPRVLPALDSLERALKLGFPAGHILCMQGPFTKECNVALMRQYQIAVLVTKATGKAGGFWEKVEAAREAGATLLVIGRPLHEEGYTMEALQEALKEAKG